MWHTCMHTAPLHLPKKVTQKLSVNHIGSSDEPPTKEPLKRLRPKLSTLLTCLVKQRRPLVKSAHHIELLPTAITNRDPPRGLRPKVNPRIPDSKRIDFITEWEEVTNTAALNYTRFLLKQWEFTQKTARENIDNLNTRITSLNASEEEWTYINQTNQRSRVEGTQENQQQNIPSTPATRRDTISRAIKNISFNITKTILSWTVTSKNRRYKKKQPAIVNLSNYKLNSVEMTLLEKA